MYNNYLLTNNVVLKKALYIQFMYLISGLRPRKGMSRGGGGGNNDRHYASNGGAIIHV